ncbi:hypothetical protein SO802_008268 [Lithocarpus litseifolius]|uniref:Uncharacterized protein n=1 Tax=Lithocarpus litseifolius TaxID=425828 RepID=A0AAW2DCA2_9ROSI
MKGLTSDSSLSSNNDIETKENLQCRAVRGLEAQGVPSKQAEAIMAALTEVLNDSLENVAHSFVSKTETQRVIANTCVIHSRLV